MVALEAFKNKLVEWPLFAAMVLSISSVKSDRPELHNFIMSELGQKDISKAIEAQRINDVIPHQLSK